MQEHIENPDIPLGAEGVLRMDAPSPDAQTPGEAATRALPDDALIILPVRDVVLFPGLVTPIGIGRERSRAAVQEAVRLQRPIGILLQNAPDVDEPGPGDLHWVGTTASVVRYITSPEGTHYAIAKGVQRFRVLQFLEGFAFQVARVQMIEEIGAEDPQVEGRARALKQRAVEVLQLLPQVPAEMVSAFESLEGAAAL